ncbi:unnamed protein product [Dovyalis caffra]|uniref:Uncharacterized protein n=1 Tax=Dovyalis caffra TaxID=77055 RepID=A0AAV1RZC8_9ROSI|nr:unnamed protein product [Dovyalis caffra]
MGIPSELRHYWTQTTTNNQNLNHSDHNINDSNRRSFLVASPAEEQKILQARRCTQEGVRAGAKAAVITCVVTAVPTKLRLLPLSMIFNHMRLSHRNGEILLPTKVYLAYLLFK